MKHKNADIFKSNGKVACRNCSVNGEALPKEITMISENGYFFCWDCYLALKD